MKKKFLIIGQQPVMQIWEYEVEAETEEEAMAMVENGDVDTYEYTVQPDIFGDVEYSVEELES